jgi:hypothetical protein
VPCPRLFEGGVFAFAFFLFVLRPPAPFNPPSCPGLMIPVFLTSNLYHPTSRIAIQPSISPVPCIILTQSLNPCYPSWWLAGSSPQFMSATIGRLPRPGRGIPCASPGRPRPAVLKTDYPMRSDFWTPVGLRFASPGGTHRESPKPGSTGLPKPEIVILPAPFLTGSEPACAGRRSEPMEHSDLVGKNLSVNSAASPFVPLSFQRLTTIKFSNPLVLTTIRNAGGVRTPCQALQEKSLPASGHVRLIYLRASYLRFSASRPCVGTPEARTVGDSDPFGRRLRFCRREIPALRLQL